jgi:peptidoglycan L-alanyl-D-glutamate endopeptidase CwlK
MSFKLSQRSLDRLNGVKPELAAVVKRAIELTKVDFGVAEGLRTEETQKQYVAAGKSQTMNSKHLTGDAVDLVAYVNGSVSWELNLYDDIADAMKAAAIELGVSVKWGAAWNVADITKWNGTMADAMNSYIDERRAQGRRPFIDGPHFELS